MLEVLTHRWGGPGGGGPGLMAAGRVSVVPPAWLRAAAAWHWPERYRGRVRALIGTRPRAEGGTARSARIDGASETWPFRCSYKAVDPSSELHSLPCVRMNVRVVSDQLPSPVADAWRLLDEAADALAVAAGQGASADDLVQTLRAWESVSRRLDQIGVQAVADLDRQGTFAEHGYASATRALQDLLRLDHAPAAQRGAAAAAVCPRAGLDGTALPARLPATAEVFAAGDTALAHVAVITRLLASRPAGRLSPQVWADAELQLAHAASEYTPRELQQWGTA